MVRFFLTALVTMTSSSCGAVAAHKDPSILFAIAAAVIDWAGLLCIFSMPLTVPLAIRALLQNREEDAAAAIPPLIGCAYIALFSTIHDLTDLGQAVVRTLTFYRPAYSIAFLLFFLLLAAGGGVIIAGASVAEKKLLLRCEKAASEIQRGGISRSQIICIFADLLHGIGELDRLLIFRRRVYENLHLIGATIWGNRPAPSRMAVVRRKTRAAVERSCLWDAEDIKRNIIALVDDKQILTNIASAQDATEDMRSAALAKIDDKDAFSKIAQHGADAHIRKEAVKQLTDQRELGQIAATDSNRDVRLAAVAGITDQRVLEDVVNTSGDFETRKAAVKRIQDKNALASIVLNRQRVDDSDNQIRLSVLGRIDDPAVLADLAKTDPCAKIRTDAVRRLDDETVLAEVARSDSDPETRKAAVEKLDDETVLAEVARSDSNAEIRTDAVRRLDDETVLAEVARSDSDPETRKAAVGKLDDETVLAEIARSDSHADVRAAAVGQLTDKRVLDSISKNDADNDVRTMALRKLGKGACGFCGKIYDQRDAQVGLERAGAMICRSCVADGLEIIDSSIPRGAGGIRPGNKTPNPADTRCAFCQSGASRKLVGGMAIYICDECLDAAGSDGSVGEVAPQAIVAQLNTILRKDISNAAGSDGSVGGVTPQAIVAHLDTILREDISNEEKLNLLTIAVMGLAELGFGEIAQEMLATVEEMRRAESYWPKERLSQRLDEFASLIKRHVG